MKYTLLGLLLAGMSLFSTASNAEIIIGVKAGPIDFDVPLADTGTATSVQIGYEFLDLALVDVSAELELTNSATKVEINNQEYGFSSKGIFAAARTIGPIYAIGRAGLISAEVDGSSDNGTAISVGLGFSTGLRWEVEYTTYALDDSEDIKYISLGLHF